MTLPIRLRTDRPLGRSRWLQTWFNYKIIGRALVVMIWSGLFTMSDSAAAEAQLLRNNSVIATGADVLVRSGFAALDGKRVGLITNQTGRVGDRHLADLIAEAANVRLTAIFAPEHGFRGSVEAGEKVADRIDKKTGVEVHSLYGATRKPTPAMLRDVDVLVFDIQDIGVRFYTYVSTMGLAMQAAAAQGIPFLVLDRPNPLGGHYVSGFVLNSRYTSFVGQYPIPIAHGLTVGELALMIKGEGWLSALDGLDLVIGKMEGWRRDMRWPDLGREWVATSPNIPSYESALLYPGIGIVGETAVNEGRGTEAPFTRFGAPWLDAEEMARGMMSLGLPGVRFEAMVYTPRSLAGVATNPRYLNQRVKAVRVIVTDTGAVTPLEIGLQALSLLIVEARRAGVRTFFPNRRMFQLIAGDRRLYNQLRAQWSGSRIIAGWAGEVERFKSKRRAYLLY
jgi:uncharacterized protein YbbC (DUF1343 family)